MSRKLKVCLFGSRAAGKTTFLAGLEALNVPARPSRLAVSAASPEVRDRLKGLAKALRAGVWPPSTTRLEQYDLVVKVDAAGGGGTAVVHLHVLDYDGELARQLDAAGREELAELRRHVGEADVILLLLDPAQDVHLPDGASAEARQLQAERQGALVTAVEEAWRRREETPDGRTPRPMPDVVVVLSKADAVPELTDRAAARAYVETHLPGLLPKVAERVGARPAAVGVFPLSAVGAVEAVDGRAVPKPPLAPRGYDELFDFVVGLRAARAARRRKWMAKAVGACALLLAVVGVSVWADYQHYSANRVKATVEDPTQPPEVRINVATRSGEPAMLEKAVAVAGTELGQLQTEIDVASLVTLAGLTERVKKFQNAVSSGLPQFVDDAGRLTGRLHNRRRTVWHATIEQKRKNNAQDPSLVKEMGDFLAEFHDGAEAAAVRGWRDEFFAAQWQRAKAAVRLMPVTDAPTLAAKADALQGYIEQWQARHPDPAEVARMRRAVELGRRLSKRADHKVKLHESGEFTENRWHIVTLQYPGAAFRAAETEGRKTTKRWDETATISWGAGDELRVELWVYHGSYPFGAEKLAASWAGRGPLQLLALDGPLELGAAADWAGSFAGRPQVTFGLPDIDAGGVKCLREFLAPGDEW